MAQDHPTQLLVVEKLGGLCGKGPCAHKKNTQLFGYLRVSVALAQQDIIIFIINKVENSSGAWPGFGGRSRLRNPRAPRTEARDRASDDRQLEPAFDALDPGFEPVEPAVHDRQIAMDVGDPALDEG